MRVLKVHLRLQRRCRCRDRGATAERTRPAILGLPNFDRIEQGTEQCAEDLVSCFYVRTDSVYVTRVLVGPAAFVHYAEPPRGLSRFPNAGMAIKRHIDPDWLRAGTVERVGTCRTGQTPYFRCNDAAKVLGYVKYAQAVTNHARPPVRLEPLENC